MAKINLQGRTFGRLTVLQDAGKDKRSRPLWLCQCSCGNMKIIRGDGLTSGNDVSCGCYNKEINQKNNLDTITHGMSKTRTYRIWKTMHQRCTNPNSSEYFRYGGRGITVCQEWQAFERFYTDMGECPPGLSIERRDNDKGYFKDNCYWATKKEQANNRRSSRLLTFQNKTMTMAQWADETAIPITTIHARIARYKWPTGKALTTPVREPCR